MILLYNIFIRLYYLLIFSASFFNKKAKLWIRGRIETKEKLKNFCYYKKEKTIWFHVSSLGEFEQGRPLIEKIKKNYNYNIVLSFFSPSGYEIKKNYEFADLIIYLPLDTKKSARNFYEIIKPDVVIFVKYDLWYHYINEAYKREVPLYLISAVFTKNHIFFKWYGTFFRRMLKKFTHIFVQDELSKINLNSININNATITGDTRAERVIQIAQEEYEDNTIKDFCHNQFCIILGSIWISDMKILSPIIKKYLKYKWIIVPHDISNKNLNKIMRYLNTTVSFYSNYSKKTKSNIMIVDIIGILSKIYRYANIAYIGGGFGKGIHNILEPAVYGIPIFFGPKNDKFIEARQLKALKAAFEIKTSEEFEKIFQQLINDEEFRINCGNIAKKYIYKCAGATNKILNIILKNT